MCGLDSAHDITRSTSRRSSSRHPRFNDSLLPSIPCSTLTVPLPPPTTTKSHHAAAHGKLPDAEFEALLKRVAENVFRPSCTIYLAVPLRKALCRRPIPSPQTPLPLQHSHVSCVALGRESWQGSGTHHHHAHHHGPSFADCGPSLFCCLTEASHRSHRLQARYGAFSLPCPTPRGTRQILLGLPPSYSPTLPLR